MAFEDKIPDYSVASKHFHSQHECIPQRIAVLGSGIAGLSAAWALSQSHDVTLYERDHRLGGHANTVDIEIEGHSFPVDTGFIVYNEANYPNLVGLFHHLGVETADSDMSFGVSLRDGMLEYSGQTLSSVFATRSMIASPGYWRMLIDVTRFHRAGRTALQDGLDPTESLGSFIHRNRLGKKFVDDFICPMAGAIWSTPFQKVLDYPAASFLKFYDNHGLLQVLNMPLWRTVKNGSRAYVEKLREAFAGTIKLGCPVEAVSPGAGRVRVITAEGEAAYDQVVLRLTEMRLDICCKDMRGQ